MIHDENELKKIISTVQLAQEILRLNRSLNDAQEKFVKEETKFVISTSTCPHLISLERNNIKLKMIN